MPTKNLVAAVYAAHSRLPARTWELLSKCVHAEDGLLERVSIDRVVSVISNSEVKRELSDALRGKSGGAWSEVDMVIQTINHCFVQAGEGKMEMVWSGPPSLSLTARRIDQILYDLLNQAKHRAFIITFSAYRVARLCEALSRAYDRGVKVTLLLETAEDSEGQLSNDAVHAFAGLPLQQFEILHWPKNRRELNAAGKPGKLHAKCAVIDDAVVISSANLTDDAFNRNMEMGVVAENPALAESILAHFYALKATRVLCELEQ